MKILLTNNTFYPYQRGGAETIIKRLAEDWSAAGHEVLVVALKPKRQAGELSHYTPRGYKVTYWLSNYYHIENWSIWRRFIWHLPDWLGLRFLTDWLKTLNSFKPDLVVANNLTGLGFSLHFSCWRLGISSVQVLHDLQYLHPSGLLIIGQEKKLHTWSTKIYQTITASWFGSAKLLVGPSSWLINYHRQCGWLTSAKWLRLANPTPAKLAVSYRLADNLRRAVFVGQLTKAKGVLWLADQWADFNRRLLASGLKEAELIIIGDGPLDKEIQSLVEQDRQLVLLGRLSSEQVFAQLSLADVLLVPAFCYENWPTVLLEAATAGCPAIVTAQGGGGELAERLGYLTFIAGDIDSLLVAWQKLADTAAKIETWPANHDEVLVESEEYLKQLLASI